MPKAKADTKYRTLSFRVSSDGIELKTAQLNDQDHLVVPVIALVEGVLSPSNASGPELALAEEFGRFPAGWNGRPIILGHPKDGSGMAISANSPDLYNNSVIGHLFNSVVDGAKLKGEMWINTKKAGKDVINRFKDSVVEVSTGLYAQAEESPGLFNGVHYDSIWRNIVPDHLAILAEGVKGACSIDSGCGAPRLNQFGLKQNCETDPKEAKVLEKLFKGLKGLFQPKPDLKDLELSDMDTRVALSAALGEADSNEYTYIIAVYASHFVYNSYDPQTGESHVYDRGYRVIEGGAINLSQDVVEVRPETAYVPVTVTVNNQPGEIPMTPEQKIQAEKDTKTLETLVTSAAAARAFLKEKSIACEGMSDVEVIVAAGIAKQKALDVKALADDEAKKKADKDAADELARQNQASKTIMEFVGSAPSPFKTDLEHALAYTNERKAMLVKGLDGKTDFTKAELEAMTPVALEKIARAVKIDTGDASYVGQAPANLMNKEKPEPKTTPIREAFPRKKEEVI